MDQSHMHYIIDTFFLLFSSVLIIFMVPGFAMLEAGLVRSKNVSAVLTGNVMLYAITSFIFLLWGYNNMFGGNGFFLEGVTTDGYSPYAYFLFQMAFVSKTVSIMSGGVSERIRIIPFMIFAVLMSGFIYPIVGNAIWGGGFLKEVHDLAGCTVIHSVGGWALLAGILVLGARRGRYSKEGQIRAIPASNIPLVTLGGMLLWIGWFGFNGGSAFHISSVENADLVGLIIVNTNTAGLAGAIIAAMIVYIQYRKLDITMILNGALGGLVAITAGADVVGLWEPIIIGAVGGTLVVFAIPLFDKFKIDDPVGALSVHLVNGIWGTIAVALFADFSLVTQLKGIAITGLFTFPVSYVAFVIIKKVIGLRSDEEHEYVGLDLEECGLEAYPEFIKSKV
ncbi:ammonium transporter [Sulfurospirillum diekertiae]|uniref:Ammonium transporter NrgA n=1 Tax=Sulfurospirillum diekertiae TaxID=1854492 RepID=A0A1Y0HJ03_9BACT|nr:ammonium transporter [Sulfurospirillum diekertiae]ARU47335.1 Ammonium transporter NrgA [Sulfurospirillum diekertiae]ASC92187.1 Ammonium transporter NrgA [Sulfurospirillum diekertiae]